MSELKLTPEMIEEIKKGKKISAIKMVRAKYLLGLAESKQLVDNYCAQHPEQDGVNAEPSSPSLLPKLIIFALAFYGAFKLLEHFGLLV